MRADRVSFIRLALFVCGALLATSCAGDTTADAPEAEISLDEIGRVAGIQGQFWLTVAGPGGGLELRSMIADSVVTFTFDEDQISVDPGVGCTLFNGQFAFTERGDIDVNELESETGDCEVTAAESSQIMFLGTLLESSLRAFEQEPGVRLRSDGGTVVLTNEPTAVLQVAKGDIFGAYLSTEVRGQNGEPRPLIEDSPLSVEFNGQSIKVFPGVGCNGSNGDFYVSDEGLLILPRGDLESSLVDCETTVAESEQESFVQAFIRSSPKIKISGDMLTLSNDEFVIELLAADSLS